MNISLLSLYALQQLKLLASQVKSIAMMRPMLLFLLIAICTNYIVEGHQAQAAGCSKSIIGLWTCSPCGKGTRCHSCTACTGYCYRGQDQTKRSAIGIEYGSVEAPYKVPFLDMFKDIDALLKLEEISDSTVVDIFKEASDVIRKDCKICNNSPDLNSLSIFTGQVYVDLKNLIGTQLFKEKAIEKTAETTNLVEKLPESLKIKVEATSSILESNYLKTIKVESNKQLGSKSKWGPNFTVKFDINVANYQGSGSGKYSDVLHFTATSKTCCSAGDRIPSVHLHSDNRILVSMWGTFDGGPGNTYYTSGRMDVDRWYNIEIEQLNVRFHIELKVSTNILLSNKFFTGRIYR